MKCVTFLGKNIKVSNYFLKLPDSEMEVQLYHLTLYSYSTEVPQKKIMNEHKLRRISVEKESI